jgi:hypothetical protein
MRKLLGAALAVLALGLLGATTEQGWPACSAKEGDPKVFENFVQALVTENVFRIQYYEMHRTCGALKGGMLAEVLEVGKWWVKVRVWPKPNRPEVVFTSPAAIKE